MSPYRVLVVDDEADIRTILALTLRRAGYEAALAGDGVEALEAIERQPPDLVLLDVMMPRLDGFETLRRIREGRASAQLPVILLTARAQLADRMKGFERGADDYVPKPFEPAEVLARVQSVLRRVALARLASPLIGPLGDWFSAEGLQQLGRDLEAAREIQSRLLPPVPPTLAGLGAGGVVRPSTVVGGDFFDIVPMRERVGVAVGDVSGKGIPAALLMVMTRTLLREIGRELSGPGEVLTRLNASLCRDMPPSMFVTMVLAVLDPERPGQVTLAGGGHPEPVILAAGGPSLVAVGGLPLGAFEEATFEEAQLTLGPGEALVLFTDGLVEGRDAAGRRPGLPRLLETLARRAALGAPALVEAVAEDVLGWSGAGLRDDLTVFVLKR
ncbi:MAG: hypothetical protein A2X52_22420 [Candidatus Rokubacteria bacterium GWC2_70_16]|nr:MAG: hypothetical protein A2X52_22420 [Candidatus Rokubacteria bacterium GWC2_70_16]OGL17930.1 MAG: hypothetical protein A3K12_16940 [Candidatus Rokubacteria bacterium RIFCSPLOWO2_12_FULL_71_19]